MGQGVNEIHICLMYKIELDSNLRLKYKMRTKYILPDHYTGEIIV